MDVSGCSEPSSVPVWQAAQICRARRRPPCGHRCGARPLTDSELVLTIALIAAKIYTSARSPTCVLTVKPHSGRSCRVLACALVRPAMARFERFRQLLSKLVQV